VIVLDLFNREVVGWSLKPRMSADLVIDALSMACFRRKPAPGLIHHSDRGSQYASHAFQGKLAEYGMLCSMSRKGNCWDNAPTESWFNSFKNERIFGERFASHEAMKSHTIEYIEVFYNRKRLHSTLGYTPPVQFLKDWSAARKEEHLVASAHSLGRRKTEGTSDHGRLEIRRYWITEGLRTLPNTAQWIGLRSIGMVERLCTLGDTQSVERRFFLNSIAPEARRFAHAVRGHWGVENRLHWRLDVVFC